MYAYARYHGTTMLILRVNLWQIALVRGEGFIQRRASIAKFPDVRLGEYKTIFTAVLTRKVHTHSQEREIQEIFPC